jgi:molecular chaperone DnaK (HSP70)
MVTSDVSKLSFKVQANPLDDTPKISIPSLKVTFTPEEISAVIIIERKKIADAYLKKPMS